eukprot:7568910-Pyramimonas_sp.AAC.2
MRCDSPVRLGFPLSAGSCTPSLFVPSAKSRTRAHWGSTRYIKVPIRCRKRRFAAAVKVGLDTDT